MRAELIDLHGKYYYKPNLDNIQDHMKLLPILSLADWEAVQHEWRPPLANIVDPKDIHGLWTVQKGIARPLIQIAALQGFPAMSEAAVARLCEHLGVKIPVGSDLFEKLKLLIKHCCSWISEEELWTILQSRHLDPSLDTAALLSSEVTEVFGKDAEEVGQWAQTKLKQHASLQPFQDKLDNMAKQFKPKTPAASKVPKSSSKASSSTSMPSHTTPNDQELFTEGTARTLLPPEPSAKIYKDFYNSRWLGFIHGQSRSRSWSVHGDTKSLCLVVTWLWTVHQRAGGSACPFDWVNKAAKESC